MSIIDTVKDRIAKAKSTGMPVAPAVEAELRAAETDLSALEARRGELALSVTLGEQDADAAMAKYRTRVDDLRHRVSDLRAAHATALVRDSAAVVAAKAAVHASQIKAVRAHLSARDAALERMSAHLASAVAQFDIAVKAGSKASNASPSELPHGNLCSRASLDRVIAHEIFRLSAPLMAGHDAVTSARFTFAGGKSPTLTEAGQPEALQSLADLAHETTEYIIASLTGKPWSPKAEDEPVAVADPVVEAHTTEAQPTGAIDARTVPLPLAQRMV